MAEQLPVGVPFDGEHFFMPCMKTKVANISLTSFGQDKCGRYSYFHAPLYIFYRDPLGKYTGWCINDFTTHGIWHIARGELHIWCSGMEMLHATMFAERSPARSHGP